MFLLPYEHFTIKTTLPADEVSRRIQQVVEPRRFFRGWLSDHKPYEGEVSETYFSVRRIIHYQNSFLPKINGEIIQEMEGCRIVITMQPHILVIAFMIFWLTGVAFGFFATLWAMINMLITSGFQQDSPFMGLLATGGMFLFGYGISFGGFQWEASKSKAFFRNLFNEVSIEESGWNHFLGLSD